MASPLANRSFLALTASQFLGAFNDNVYRQLILLFAMGILVFVTDTWPVSLVVGVAGGILVGTAKVGIIVLIEEVVFRGFFIQYLGAEVRQSVLLSSLLFGMAHIPAMVNSGVRVPFLLVGVASFFALGIALGLSFVRTGNSLALPLGLHLGYNLGYSFLIFVVSVITKQPMTVKYIGPAWLVGQPSWAPESGLTGILVTSALIGCVMVLTTKQMARRTA
ncbi:MAG: CPBP family intramembrane metalloprotease [Anaerolineales bacterium]|nr:CPBP family intramembrane metalloprotease [Anaerolineales bacterium]